LWISGADTMAIRPPRFQRRFTPSGAAVILCMSSENRARRWKMIDGDTALAKRNKLIAKIVAQYDAGAGAEVLPVVSLEDFFDGNWDEHSLAPNMVGYGRPPLRECYDILREIRGRPEVQDVLVAIHESPDADDPEDFEIWPDSDTVYVLTSATRENVAQWAGRLKPDDV